MGGGKYFPEAQRATNPEAYCCPAPCPGEEQAGDEAGTWDQRREDAHEGDAAAGGGTHYAQEDEYVEFT